MGDVLLLAKDDHWCNHAVALARIAFADRLIARQGTSNHPFPAIPEHSGFALLSFRSPWIVPAVILGRFDIAINFHPGTRDYPGYGCYSFAIYEGAAEYGCVCHHMAAAVDTGPLIAERRFPMIEHASVETLKLRTYTVMLALFHEIVFQLARGKDLPLGAFCVWVRSQNMD